MKKAFKIALLFALLTLALSITAGAQYTDFTKVPTGKEIIPEAGKYTVTATNTGTSDAQCVVLVLKGLWEQTDFTNSKVSLTADSILYIDQKPVPANNGTTNGTIDFTVYPKSLPDSTVILTGLTSNPQVVGYTEGKGVSVSGTVNKSGAVATTVTLYDNTGTSLQSVQTKQSVQPNTEEYELTSVPVGATYYIKATAPGFVSTPVTKIVGNGGNSETAEKIMLYGGDTDCNTAINVDDLGFLLKDFGKVTALQHAQCDVDSNGAVNVDDLSFLLRGFGKNDVSIIDYMKK